MQRFIGLWRVAAVTAVFTATTGCSEQDFVIGVDCPFDPLVKNLEVGDFVQDVAVDYNGDILEVISALPGFRMDGELYSAVEKNTIPRVYGQGTITRRFVQVSFDTGPDAEGAHMVPGDLILLAHAAYGYRPATAMELVRYLAAIPPEQIPPRGRFAVVALGTRGHWGENVYAWFSTSEQRWYVDMTFRPASGGIPEWDLPSSLFLAVEEPQEK